MATRPTPFGTIKAGKSIGAYLAAWRKLQNLPAAVVADRAAISAQTLSRLENGDVHVGLDTVLNVAAALGLRDEIVAAFDPFESEFGRARSDQVLPKRIRR
ncbi:MAG: helix-turn-helix domain-containing protein [Propionibacteriaceae bacterium]